jgi:hypothetical protein
MGIVIVDVVKKLELHNMITARRGMLKGNPSNTSRDTKTKVGPVTVIGGEGKEQGQMAMYMFFAQGIQGPTRIM